MTKYNIPYISEWVYVIFTYNLYFYLYCFWFFFNLSYTILLLLRWIYFGYRCIDRSENCSDAKRKSIHCYISAKSRESTKPYYHNVRLELTCIRFDNSNCGLILRVSTKITFSDVFQRYFARRTVKSIQELPVTFHTKLLRLNRTHNRALW